MKKILFILSPLAVLASACRQIPEPKTSITNTQSKTESPRKQKITNADVVKFIKNEVKDNEGTHMVASTYLLPEGWTVQDKLYWEYRDPTVPIRYQGIYKSSDGNLMIQAYPDVRASWYTGPAGTNGYRPPSDIITGLKDLVKKERNGLNVRYTEQKVVSESKPQTSYQQGSEVLSSSQAGFVRIEYEENNQTYEEEFYGQLDISDVRTPSAMGNMRASFGAQVIYIRAKRLKAN